MVEPYAVRVRSNRNKCLQALNWPMQHVGVTFLLNESDFFLGRNFGCASASATPLCQCGGQCPKTMMNSYELHVFNV